MPEWRARACPMLGEASDNADDLALDLDVARVDRLHLPVRRLQADAVFLAEEALQGRAAVLEQRDDDVAVARGVLRLHDDVVAVVDVVLDHRFPAHAKDERVAALRRELTGDRERFALVLVCVDRLARGDLADDRRLDDATTERAGDRERARAGGVLLKLPLALEL